MCVGGGIYFLYSKMSIQCVENAFTVIYFLLVARNLNRYISILLFIFWLLDISPYWAIEIGHWPEPDDTEE